MQKMQVTVDQSIFLFDAVFMPEANFSLEAERHKIQNPFHVKNDLI